MNLGENENALDGRMTVAECRRVQMKCSENLHARIADIKVDLALIKRHLGINGQYKVEPVSTRRTGDVDEHHHLRTEDVVISQVGQVSFPVPPRWLIILGVVVFLLAGAGLLLIIQTKTDLDQIMKYQALSTGKATQNDLDSRTRDHIIKDLQEQ